MKSVRQLITEKKKEEAFPVSDVDKKKLQRQARPETSSLSSERIRRGLDTARKPLSSDEIIGAWKSAKSAKPSVVATSSKPESGVYFGSSKKAIKTAQEQEKRQQVRDTIAKNPTASAELQAAQSSGPKETMVGKGAKSGTGATYRANRPSETQATGVSNLPPKGQSRGRTGSKQFSGDARYREMLAKMDDAPAKKPRTRTVKQAEVSKEIAQKTADYKTERGERAYRKTSADIEARRAFPTGKGGLKADEANPYVKREVRQARAAKLGGNVWDQPKGSSEPFKGQGKSPSKTTYPSFFKPTKPNVTASRISKTAAPGRPATKQAVQFLKNLRRKSSSTSTPKNATTHGVGPDGKYLSPEMRKAAHKNRNVSSVVVYQEPKKKNRTSPAELARREQSKQTAALQKSQKQLGQQFARSIDRSTKQTTAAMERSSAQMSKAMGNIQKTQARKLQGASAALSVLGATQEYKAGAERARRQGYGKLGQIAQGGIRAAGAAAGGTIGGVIGGRVGGGVGAALGGGYLYSQGAKAGTKVFDTVAKSSQGRWLAKQAKKLVPGLA
jgi:hypothetical protein